MNEIIASLATQPSVKEWRCIREFKRRARELTENSLLRNGYDLSANVSWKTGCCTGRWSRFLSRRSTLFLSMYGGSQNFSPANCVERIVQSIHLRLCVRDS